MWKRAKGVDTVTVIYNGEVGKLAGQKKKAATACGCILGYRELAGSRDHDITSVAMEMVL